MSKISRELTYAELESIVGAESVSDRESDVVGHSLNRNWYTRTLKKDGKPIPKASFVVYPKSTEQVSGILEFANRQRIPVTPYGHGSSGMGGNIPVPSGIMLDMKKMNDIVEVNEETLSATVESGISCRKLEEEMNRIGYTTGHLPASHFCSTIGGFLALRSAGRLSTGYGKIEDMSLALEVVLANGNLYRSKQAPRHATGPDFDQMFIGSEGALGVITKSTLKIHPYPEKRVFRGILLPDLHSGIQSMRKVMQAGLEPCIGRLYTEEETSTLFKETWGLDREGAFLIVGFDGEEKLVDVKEELALDIFEKKGGEDYGREKGKHWWEHRYDDYYPKDKKDAERYQGLLGGGFVGGTVDTCLPYGEAEDAYKDLLKTFDEEFGDKYETDMYGHYSHWYKHGTMFYVRWHLRDVPKDENKVRLYNKVWSTLEPIVLKHNGVIEHHHGLGKLLGRFLKNQYNPGYEVLEKVKKSLDPNNILNPGVLGLGVDGY